MKKYLLVVTLGFISFLLGGCSPNESAEAVAKEMVKRLSHDDYENMSEIFYQEEGVYFDEGVFKDLIIDKSLDISGNRKKVVKEVGPLITNVDGYPTKEVVIAIDDDKVFKINTVLVNNKWYVYEPEFYDNALVIAVPKGAKVKINDNELDESYKKVQEVTFDVGHPDLSSYRSVELKDVTMETYVLDKVLRGYYNVTVEASQTVSDVIVSYSNKSNINSINYAYESSSSDGMLYIFNVNEDNKEVKDFVSDYLNNIYTNAVNTHSFDGVSKYFDDTSLIYDNVLSSYASAIKKFGNANISTLPNSYYDNFKIENLEYKNIYYYNDDNIAVAISYTLGYQFHKKYTNSSWDTDTDKKSEMDTIIILKKENGSYKIKNGYSLFAK